MGHMTRSTKICLAVVGGFSVLVGACAPETSSEAKSRPTSPEAASGAGSSEATARRHPRWLVYLESDIIYPRPGITVAAQRNDLERCGTEKFDQLWRITSQLIDKARTEEATIELIANLDSTITSLGPPVAFNDDDDDIKRYEAGAAPEMTRRRQVADRKEELIAATKQQREAHKNALMSSPQRGQNMFQAVGHMLEVVPGLLRGSAARDVIVFFVSDMVHYNTSETWQLDPKAGLLNMFRDKDRAVLLAEQSRQPGWWINGRILDPLATTGSHLEVRTLLVDRCPTGEAVDRSGAPNWPLVRGDVQRFWARVFSALNVELRWNYKPV